MRSAAAPPRDGAARRHRERASSARLLVVILALLFASTAVLSDSRAGFVGSTGNSGSSLGTGNVSLGDDDLGAALFSVTNLLPLDVVTECVRVTYNGTVTPIDVRMYGDTGGSLPSYLTLTVQVGTGGTFSDCTGFVPSSTIFSGTLAAFVGDHTGFADGLDVWSPASSPETRTVRISMVVIDDNLAQGLTATPSFTWETQTT